MIARWLRVGALRFLGSMFLVALGALSCGDETTGPSECPECADDLVLLANAALETALYDELNSTPERPADIDFTEPNRLYREALSEDGNDLDARFGVATTDLLILTSDSEVNAAFDEWDAYLSDHTPFETTTATRKPLGIPIGLMTGADGLRLPFEVITYSALAHGQLPRLSADPQLSHVQDILRERVLPKLADAITHLGMVGADPDYRFIVTPRMQGDDYADPVEVDQTDILALRAASYLLSAACRIAVSYEVGFAAYDSTHLQQAFEQGSGWMALLPDGLTQMQTAHTEILASIDEVDHGLTALLAENDSQHDDVIKIGPDGISRRDIDEIRNRNLPDIRRALTVGYTRSDDWDNNWSTPDEALTINVGNLLTDPVQDWKSLFPPYTVRIDRELSRISREFPNGTSLIQVEIPTADTYFAFFEVFLNDGQVTNTRSSGPDFLVPALSGVVNELLTTLELNCVSYGAVKAEVYGFLETGMQTIDASWDMTLDIADVCVYIPVIVWDANSMAEWTWPDPTFGGLLPEMTSMDEVYDLLGIVPSDFIKEWVLDWPDLLP